MLTNLEEQVSEPIRLLRILLKSYQMSKKTKFYGQKGTNNPMPENYDPNTELEIKRGEYTIATGKWISTYDFVLHSGSLLFGRNNYKGPGTALIVEDLKKDELIEDPTESDYTLIRDIHLYSPSAAGKLVLGQQSNGHKDWVRKIDGVSLSEL